MSELCAHIGNEHDTSMENTCMRIIWEETIGKRGKDLVNPNERKEHRKQSFEFFKF